VDILEEAARATYALGGGITVFCKSGKDRTAMAVTLHQSKALGEYHGCGTSPERVFTDASLMRGYGTRIDVANKNTGAYKYSFNPLQVCWLFLFVQPFFNCMIAYTYVCMLTPHCLIIS
jgi:hypothetical protein